MQDTRKYGTQPYRIALIHGGPGAAGEMAEVAGELQADFGVLEPMQKANSVTGQVRELKNCLSRDSDYPIILIGFSWGAWLSLLVAARYPRLVKKLLLIGCGPLKEEYAVNIQDTRLNRLTRKERVLFRSLMKTVNDPFAPCRDRAFSQLGELLSQADAFDPLIPVKIETGYSVDIFFSVWQEAALLRKKGKLLKWGKKIKCPVAAIHGDYDPHPVEGVSEPLGEILADFKVHLLKQCGHKPWIEKQAKDNFYQILRQELVV